MAGKTASKKKKELENATGTEPDKTTSGVLALCGLVSTIVMFSLGYVFRDIIPVPGEDAAPAKLIYTFRCAFFAAITLFFFIMATGWKRDKVGAINPLAGKEHLIQVDKNVLTNTVEQFLVYLVSVVVLASYLETVQMSMVLVYTATFVVGRILFRTGYLINPMYRAFGMIMNFASTFYVVGFIIYQMYTKGFMYDISSTTEDTPHRGQRGEL